MSRLARSTEDRVIAGIAGGLAEWLRADPTVVRLAFVVLTFANAIGLLAYATLLVILPEDREGGAHRRLVAEDPPTPPLGMGPGPATGLAAGDEGHARRAARSRAVVGSGIALVGMWLLGRQLGLVPDLRWPIVGPLVLVGVGLILLAGRGDDDAAEG